MATTAATLRGAQTGLSDETLDQLRGLTRGEVLTATDDGLSRVRPAFNAMHQGEPAFAVECTGTADVIDAVAFARERGLVVAVRGGGHSISGLSTQAGGVLIDLAQLNGVEIDVDARVAHVQGGALWGDVDRESSAFGLATPGGVVSDTGVGGLTLGGGYGWLRRKFGLSCDNLLSARVVCADGKVRTASAMENPDLFWALRGGGGNFGVVTSFDLRLHEVGPIVAFAGVMYPIETTAQVLRAWRDYVLTAPDEVTSATLTITMPAAPGLPEAVHNRQVMVIGGVYSGSDLDEGMRIMQPLRELGTPLADISQPMPFTAVQSAFDAFFPRGQFQAYWKSQYLDEFSNDAIDVVADRAQHRPAPFTLVNMFHMGGAIARISPEATAFAQRTAPFMASIDGNWTDPGQNAANIGWVRDSWDRVRRFGNGSVYLNFMGRSDEALTAGVDSAFGRNLRRLAEIKAVYDPENFFRLNNNVAPAVH